MSASSSLRDLRQARPRSGSLVICRTGSAGSLALVESAGDQVPGTTGRTLTGTAAVFDQWQFVNDPIEGPIVERIGRGAFTKTLAENQGRVPLLLDHGRHPQLGSMMLGVLRSVSADASGLQYVAELHNGLPELLREGLAAGQYGSSFRARTIKSRYERRPPASAYNPDRLVEVTRTELQLLDISPTSLPAYPTTSARLRTALAPERPSARIGSSMERDLPAWLLCRDDDDKPPAWFLGDLRDPAWKLGRRGGRHGRAFIKAG